jgi:NADH:ubiquinone oxidoreductase subunit 4 (subunit M)
MGIEFMVGATIFALIRVTVILFAAWMLYRVVTKVWKYINPSQIVQELPNLNVKKEIIALGLVFLVVTFGGASSPKLTIEVPQDRELKQYQQNTDNIIIHTPPPRTEKLDGFKPLGE